jgi:hypothetical protein
MSNIIDPPSPMTTVGYGDIAANAMDEKMFAILVMIIGAGLFGYGVSNIVNIVGDISIQERQFRQKMDRVNGYLSEKEIPERLKGEIREFFHLKRRSKHSTIGR